MTFFRELKCGQCQEPFQISETTYQLLKRSSTTFYCPWGHPRHYPQGKSETEKAKEEAAEMRRQRDLAIQREARLREERDAAERRVSAAKGQVTKLKKRAAGGVCPCCNRTFAALARHMKTKHPEFTATEVMQ